MSALGPRGQDPASIGALAASLAEELRDVALPLLGSPQAREHVGLAEGGDVTFAIDELAEQRVESFLAENAPSVAFYSEDRGMVTPSGADPEWVLVVDPVDGTRPAVAGLESCCVSIAAARLSGEPTIGDVEAACVLEIKSGARFEAVKGGGLEPSARLSECRDVGRMFWTYGLRGRPTRALMEVLAELVDASSVGGASFDLGSASFDMTRIVTGQLDAYVEPGPRLVEEVPGMRAEFERIGGGAVLNNTPYDLAAAWLCLVEAGAVVTDASGRGLETRPLLGSGPEHQISCIACSTEELHREICRAVEHGIARVAQGGRSDG